MSARVHLVGGGVGAGKTTFAMALAERLGALRISVDVLMQQLFGPDTPEAAGYDWYLPRVIRCEVLAVELAAPLIALGHPVVLDFGFLGREQRDRVRNRCNEAQLPTQLHFLDVPAAERWARVERRNTERAETFAMPVSRDLFDFCQTLLEPPTADEPVQTGPITPLAPAAHLELTTVVVADYDQAIAFYTEVLGFELVEDSAALTNDGRPKRWVVVRPRGGQTGLLLAQADGPRQLERVGDQCGGRVSFFLRVEDFEAQYQRLLAAKLTIVRPPRQTPYGQVAVFEDRAGNPWDLLGPRPSRQERAKNSAT